MEHIRTHITRAIGLLILAAILLTGCSTIFDIRDGGNGMENPDVVNESTANGEGS